MREPLSYTCLIVCSLLVSPVFSQEVPKPPRVEKKVLSVQGNAAATNTGIKLKPSDRVSVKASGSVCFSNGDDDSCVTANGYAGEHGPYAEAWRNDYYQCDDPLPTANHAGLIANIGNSDLFLGAEKTFSGQQGALYLGVNDCSLTGDYHNTGSFEVIVTVKRK